MIDKDDFDLWLANPVTEAVFRMLKQEADGAKEQWVRMSWAGQIDQLTHQYLRARADTYNSVCELEFKDLEESHDEERERNPTD